MHKDILPLKGIEFWGLVLVFWFMWYANMGGVGGGGIVVPIGILFFKFDPKNAIALSNFSIFLSSLIRYFMFANTPHPLKKGKGLIISYDLAIIMLPMIISGVSIGVIFNIIVSDLIICIFYVLLITGIGIGVFKKALRLYLQEKAVANFFQDKVAGAKLDIIAKGRSDIHEQRVLKENSDGEDSEKHPKGPIELKEIKLNIKCEISEEDFEDVSERKHEIYIPQGAIDSPTTACSPNPIL